MDCYLMIAPIGKELPIEDTEKLISYWHNEYYSFCLLAHIPENVYLA